MATLTDTIHHTADFLVREANGYRSRSVGSVDGTAAALEPGTILGKITATSKFVRYAPGASDGSQTVAGILYQGVAAAQIADRTYIDRDAEVNGGMLIYSAGADATAKGVANAALLTLLGIKVR